MNFSTTHLFLLVASWPIAFALSPFLSLEALGIVTIRVTYHFTSTKNTVTSAVRAGDPLFGAPPETKADLLPLWTGPWAWKDSWQRPLGIVTDENGNLRRDAGQILVYSMGSDGLSESNGNDPDDINSWDNHHHEFYRNQLDKRELNARLWRTVWLTPLVFAAILGVLGFKALFDRKLNAQNA